MALDPAGNSSPGIQVRTFKLAGCDVEPVESAAYTLDQTSLYLPQGTYTTLRTYGGDRFLRLESHLHRLDESARLLGHPVELDHVAIRAGLRQVLQLTGFEESRIRLTAALCEDRLGVQVYLSVEPFVGVPDELYVRGVRAVTRPLARQQPRAKNTGFIAPSRQVKHALPPDVFEVLIANERGQILEGMTSNFFAVLEGTLRTAGEGVLEGVTRSLVLQIADQRLPIRLEPVTRGDLGLLAEAFLTSASREVIPVVEIDGVRIGTGMPGPAAREIHLDYRARVLVEAQLA